MNEYLKGDDVLFYIRYNGNWKVVACLIDNPLTEDTEVIETTARGSGGWRSYIGGLQDYSITLNAHLVVGDEFVSYEHLKGLKREVIPFEWRLMSVGGEIADTGVSFISSLSQSNATNDVVSFSATLTPSVGGIGNILVWSQDGFNVVQDGNNNAIQI